eukprot:1145532-Prorocentrum_minimum.AAC.1
MGLAADLPGIIADLTGIAVEEVIKTNKSGLVFLEFTEHSHIHSIMQAAKKHKGLPVRSAMMPGRSAARPIGTP